MTLGNTEDPESSSVDPQDRGLTSDEGPKGCLRALGCGLVVVIWVLALMIISLESIAPHIVSDETGRPPSGVAAHPTAVCIGTLVVAVALSIGIGFAARPRR